MIVSSWCLRFSASKPKSGRNSTYPSCADSRTTSGHAVIVIKSSGVVVSQFSTHRETVCGFGSDLASPPVLHPAYRQRLTRRSPQPHQHLSIASVGFTPVTGRRGIMAGKTTAQSKPSFVSNRCRPYLHGLAPQQKMGCLLALTSRLVRRRYCLQYSRSYHESGFLPSVRRGDVLPGSFKVGPRHLTGA